LRNFNYTKTISQIAMYYAETRADNSGYANHMVICLVVVGSPFDSEQVCRVSQSKRGNNSNKMLDGIVYSCQQIGVNTFYKCVEFQINSFVSY
jgi:hypothetical protein